MRNKETPVTAELPPSNIPAEATVHENPLAELSRPRDVGVSTPPGTSKDLDVIPFDEEIDTAARPLNYTSNNHVPLSSNANLQEENNTTIPSDDIDVNTAGLELSVDLAGPSNLVVVTHSSSNLAIQEAEAVVNNSWADLAEDEENKKQPAKAGKKQPKKTSQKPKRGQIPKSFQ